MCRLREGEHWIPLGRVLCLAEGEGRNAVFVARTGREVHSVDLTEAGVSETLRLAAKHDVDVVEGAGHTGRGAVVQMIARKP